MAVTTMSIQFVNTVCEVISDMDIVIEHIKIHWLSRDGLNLNCPTKQLKVKEWIIHFPFLNYLIFMRFSNIFCLYILKWKTSINKNRKLKKGDLNFVKPNFFIFWSNVDFMRAQCVSIFFIFFMVKKRSDLTS